MEYVYAAMLLHKAGKPVNEENLNNVLNAAGINPDAARVKSLVAALAEVNIEEAIKTAPAFAAPAAPAASAPAAPAKEEKKEEKKKEDEKQKEEAALEGLGALFG
ncbi:MAG: 50S ribosomal protein P1 [Candidatus Bathyarchaeia archaeon]|jgi:large subunit ribosomal protein L12|nr:50S ribosomal protein P1 [Candidatus Bathyarchaeota archaeon A05DMB-4]MDH7596060.1 50S ribosomal protein P1 [Candidatus Bathyarchaeota archaeon]